MVTHNSWLGIVSVVPALRNELTKNDTITWIEILIRNLQK